MKYLFCLLLSLSFVACRPEEKVVPMKKVAPKWVLNSRISARGVVEYSWDQQGRYILAPLEGDMERCAAAARQPVVDLLQGEFLPDSKRARPASRRRLAWLGIVLLASPLLLVAAQALRLELAARALEARAAAVIADALPVAGAAQAEQAAPLQQRLQAAREPRAFAAATGALFAAVAARPGLHLVELEYQRGDRLRAILAHPGADDLEAVRAALAGEGWRLVEGGSRDAPGGLRTAISLEPDA